MTVAIVCGGRLFDDREMLRRVLSAFHAEQRIDLLVHGGAKRTKPAARGKPRIVVGADYFAGQWAVDNQVSVREIRPDWDKHGNAAGPIRNRRMLVETDPDLVVAFPGDKGTADMIAQAERAKVTVYVVDEGGAVRLSLGSGR